MRRGQPFHRHSKLWLRHADYMTAAYGYAVTSALQKGTIVGCTSVMTPPALTWQIERGSTAHQSWKLSERHFVGLFVVSAERIAKTTRKEMKG